MSFPVIVKQFRHRAEARHFVMRHHLRHGIISRLMLSYIRGQRCLPERQPRGRPRETDAPIPPPGNIGSRKTLGVLAETHGVSRETLRLDMAFAQAVDRLVGVWLKDEEPETALPLTAAECPEGEKLKNLTTAERDEIKRQLLGRESRVSRGQVVALAKKSAVEQVGRLREFLRTGRLPSGDDTRATHVWVRLPVGSPDEQAEELIERLGPEAAVLLSRKVLGKLYAAEDPATPVVPEAK